jgi:polyvinyl alcohol dehydrogenase (cytochrome)
LTSSRRLRALFGVGVLTCLCAAPAGAASTVDWPAYLGGPDHHSYAAGATAITPSNVPSLIKAWRFVVPDVPGAPGPQLFASPTVAGGAVYVGANNGVFYKLDETTGAVLAQRPLGYTTKITCSARGFVSTATVSPDASRANQLTVYVAAADGYLYALKASDLTTVWRTSVYTVSQTANDYFNWASPTVLGGRVYLGVSSQCDQPLVQGGVRVFDQAGGGLLGSYDTVPPGSIGGSVWTSLAADSSSVWASTGNSDETPGANEGDSFSIVRLDGATLAKQDIWTVPQLTGTDEDFGSSPTLFTATLKGTATQMVGACNKNGLYYALRAQNLAAGPVWSRKVSLPTGNDNAACLSAAVFDQTHGRLFVSSTETTVGGKHVAGSVRRLDPATGKVVWSRALKGPVLGNPSLDGAGVLAVGTWPSGNLIYLLNANNGRVLRTINVGAPVYSQPVFAGRYLFVATASGVLTAYRPKH